MELLEEEQVLDHETLTAADGGDEGGQDEPDEFEHRARIVYSGVPADRRAAFAAPQVRVSPVTT